MEQVIRLFIALVRFEMCNVPLSAELKRSITQEMLEKLYIVSGNHDLTHVVAVALKKNRIWGNDKIYQRFNKHIYYALMRYEAIKYEQEQIYEVFEREGVEFVPLKGSVIRNYYPTPWMRTSCDIDILIHEKDMKKAKKVLVSSLQYAEGRQKYHDFSMYSPTGMLLELHFRITENEEYLDKNLKKVWDYVHPVREESCQYEMTTEYLLFHAYAHMVYHFKYGGCGVRFLIDMWILEQKLVFDEQKFMELCRGSRIDYFVKNVRKLTKVWFEDEKYDSISRRVESYMLTGGVFGSEATKVKARKINAKGNVKYFFQRVFIPYKEFCSSYPKLEKLPVLYPYYTVKRWSKIFNKQIAKNAVQEIKINHNVQQEDVNDLKKLFRDLKL